MTMTRKAGWILGTLSALGAVARLTQMAFGWFA